MDRVAELFGILSTRSRVGLILQLHERPQSVGELAEALSISQPLTSQHLRVLRSANLVRGVRQGRDVVYAVTDDHVSHIVMDAIKHIKEEAQ